MVAMFVPLTKYRHCHSRIFRCTEHVARMEEGRNASKFEQVNLQDRDLWELLDIDGRTILELI
jgi:hypothetical protein